MPKGREEYRERDRRRHPTVSVNREDLRAALLDAQVRLDLVTAILAIHHPASRSKATVLLKCIYALGSDRGVAWHPYCGGSTAKSESRSLEQCLQMTFISGG